MRNWIRSLTGRLTLKLKSIKSSCRLHLTLEPDLVPLFFQFLQRGVVVEARIDCAIRTFLCDQLGLDPEYLDGRIQTLFLDGKSVDDLDSPILKQGSVLSLSAAMPGLLGAVLRRGSHYAAMRAQLSHKGEPTSVPDREGKIVLKLFNLLTRELGPIVLKRGIWIEGKDLGELFSARSDRFRAGCLAARIDGDRVNPDNLADIEWGDGMVFLWLQD